MLPDMRIPSTKFFLHGMRKCSFLTTYAYIPDTTTNIAALLNILAFFSIATHMAWATN